MLCVMGDGRVFGGTARQVVDAMRRTAAAAVDLSLSGYVSWVVANVRRLEHVELEVVGGTEDELAASLLNELHRFGFSRCL